MVKRILVGLGGTRFTDAAIRHAVELSRRHRAVLTGATVVDPSWLESGSPSPEGSPHTQQLRRIGMSVTREGVDAAIERFCESCVEAEVPHQVLVEHDRPFDVLVSQARYNDLMIFGMRSIFDYALHGEAEYDPTRIATRLIGEGVRPILAVAAQYRAIRRAFIAYSGSMESAKAMKHFVQLGVAPDVALKIFAFDLPVEQGAEMLDDAAEYCRSYGFDPETDYAAAPPNEQLLAEADKWGADLIVMGNSARTLFLRKIFGETAIHALQAAEVPLFLSQ